MSEIFWWLEFVRVLLAYLALTFGLPSILFRHYLRGKGRTFWFGFCVTASVMLISTVVILLGLVHLLNVWVIRVLFYGSLALSLGRLVPRTMTLRYLVYKVQNHTYGWKLLTARAWEGLSRGVRGAAAWLWRILRANLPEIVVLLGLTVYGVLYLAWNPIHTHGYGFSDVIVHHSWTYALEQGQVFSAGIYPEAMHCMAYAISTLFGMELYNVLLYLQCANNVVFLISIYLFAREIGGWKGSALAMLAAFLTIRLDTMVQIGALSRFQSALPQEYGLYTVFLIPAFLLRYLKHASQVEFRGKKTRCFWDENLVVFLLAIAASISTHFYATIMALYACLGVMVVRFCKVFHWRRLVPLALSAILAVVVSFGPMMLAYASGIPFQSSIFWALNVMKEDTASQEQIRLPQAQSEEGQQTMPPRQQTEPARQPEVGLGTRISNLKTAVIDRFQKIVNGIRNGYLGLYTEGIRLLAGIGLAAVCLPLLWRLLLAVLRRKSPKLGLPVELFDGYAIVAVNVLVFLMAYSSDETGFPKLIAADRLCTVSHGFLMCLLLLPVDFALTVVSAPLGKKWMTVLSAGAAAAVVWLVVSGGYYHGFLYILGTRYNAVVDVTASIIREIPREQYTLVATTDELYQVVGRGFHEELLTFLEHSSNQEYYLPTRYVFFYLEKHPIRSYHYHFNDGPAWLAQQSYAHRFPNASVGEQMTSGSISDETAQKDMILGSKLSESYTSIYNREILESRLAIYLREFQKEYPNELNVYYEDDDFICYCLEQNPNRLFNLGARES